MNMSKETQMLALKIIASAVLFATWAILAWDNPTYRAELVHFCEVALGAVAGHLFSMEKTQDKG